MKSRKVDLRLGISRGIPPAALPRSSKVRMKDAWSSRLQREPRPAAAIPNATSPGPLPKKTTSTARRPVLLGHKAPRPGLEERAQGVDGAPHEAGHGNVYPPHHCAPPLCPIPPAARSHAADALLQGWIRIPSVHQRRSITAFRPRRSRTSSGRRANRGGASLELDSVEMPERARACALDDGRRRARAPRAGGTFASPGVSQSPEENIPLQRATTSALMLFILAGKLILLWIQHCFTATSAYIST